MSRLARLMSAHLQYLRWDGSHLRFRVPNGASTVTEAQQDWAYFMTWGLDDRLRLARRILKPFEDYMKTQMGNWSSNTSQEESRWICFLMDMHYELGYALSASLSLPFTWFGAAKKE